MKTHDFAKHLSFMAKILRSGPNTDLSDIEVTDLFDSKNAYNTPSKSEVPKALSMLVGLNNIEKEQWVELIADYEFDIEIRARDAKRDVIGKLLKHLSSHPEARDRLSGKKLSKSNNPSTELADALTILLDT